MNIATIVPKLWNHCNVLRDDGMSYGDYRQTLEELGKQKGLLGLIFTKSGGGQYFTPRPSSSWSAPRTA